MSNTETTPKATPAATKLADANDIDLTEVGGTGKTGITVGDVRLAIANREATPSVAPVAEEKRETPAERWDRLAEDAIVATAADILDGKIKGHVNVALTGDDRVLADVDDNGFVRFVYANSGKLGGLLAKRPGQIYPLLHEAAGREMPERKPKGSAFSDVVAAAKKRSDESRRALDEGKRARLKEIQERLDRSREQVESAGTFALVDRLGENGRNVGNGIGVGRTLILQKGERPIDATVAILFEREGRTLLAAVGTRVADNNAIQHMLKRVIDKDGNHRSNDEGGIAVDDSTGEAIGFKPWRERLDADHQLRMIEVGAKYYAERKAEGARRRAEKQAKRDNVVAPKAPTDDTLEELEEADPATMGVDPNLDAETGRAIEAPADNSSETEKATDEMEALLAELQERGIGSTVR